MLEKLKKTLFSFDYILAGILLAAFLIRSYGIYFDYPGGINYIWDETGSLMQLVDIIQTKNLFASAVYHYPALLTIAYLPGLALRSAQLMLVNHLPSFSALKDFVLINGLGNLYIIVRWYSIIFGTASVYLVYKIFGIFNKEKAAAYLAAIAYASSIVAVFLSHWGKAHSALIFFLLLSLYFTLRFEAEKKTKYLYLSAFFAACSASVHYIGISAAIFPLFNLIFHYKELNYKIFLKTAALGLAVIIFFYGVNYNGIRDMIANVNDNYYANTNYSGLVKVSLSERFAYVFSDSWAIEPFLTAIFFAAILFAGRTLWRDRYKRYFLLGLIFNYLLMVTVIVGPGNIRWLAVFMVLAYPLSLVTIYELLKQKLPTRISYIFCLLLILPSLAYGLKWDLVISRYTAVEAAAWLEHNTGRQEWIYSFYYNLYLPFTYRAALWNKENNGLAYKKFEYIIANKERFIDQGYNLAYDHDQLRYQDLAGEETKYAVVAADSLAELGRQAELLAGYHQISLAKSFSPFVKETGLSASDISNNPDNMMKIFQYSMAGPYISIYKIK